MRSVEVGKGEEFRRHWLITDCTGGVATPRFRLPGLPEAGWRGARARIGAFVVVFVDLRGRF